MRFPFNPTCGSSRGLATLPPAASAGYFCWVARLDSDARAAAPPEGKDGGTLMKKRGMWVAWIAALALAAMLAATPRDGTAAKCLMPDPPVLGEPDVPGDITTRPPSATLLLRISELRIWVRNGPGGSIFVVWSPRREARVRITRSSR